MALSEYDERRISTEVLIIRYKWFIDDCRDHNVPELIAIAEEHIAEATKRVAYHYEELSCEYNELGRLKTARKLAIQRNNYLKSGDIQSANKMQESIVKWCGKNPDGSPKKDKVRKWDKGWRYALKMIFLVGVLPLCGGMLLYAYLEYLLVLIFIIPGFIAFLGGALKNGAKV